MKSQKIDLIIDFYLSDLILIPVMKNQDQKA